MTPTTTESHGTGDQSSTPREDVPSTSGASVRTTVAHVVILLMVIAALWAFRLRGPINLQYDAASYFVTGTALAEGKGYKLLNEPGEGPAVQYPPVLAVLAAGVQTLVGSSDYQVVGVWLRYIYCAITAGYVLCVYALARRFVPPWAALIVGMMAALHQQTIYLSDIFFAEVPFALCATLMLILNGRSHRPANFVSAAALGAVAFLLRTAGVALLAAWCGEALLQRRWRQLGLRIVASAVPVLGWQAYVASATHSPAYTAPAYSYQRADYMYYNVPYADNLRLIDPFKPEQGNVTPGILVRRVVSNMRDMVTGLGESVTSNWSMWRHLGSRATARTGLPLWDVTSPIAYGTFVVLRLVPLLGLALLVVRRREVLIPLYVMLSAAVISTTPWPAQFTRYLMPVAGLVALAMVYAVMSIARPLADRLGRRWISIAGMGVVAVIVLGVAAASTARMLKPPIMAGISGGPKDDSQRLLYFDPAFVTYDDALHWVRDNTPPGAVLGVTTPQYAFILSERKSVMFPFEINADRASALLASVPVDYVILDRTDVGQIVSRYAQPAIESNPHTWQLMHTMPDGRTKIYQRVTPALETGPK